MSSTELNYHKYSCKKSTSMIENIVLDLLIIFKKCNLNYKSLKKARSYNTIN